MRQMVELLALRCTRMCGRRNLESRSIKIMVKDLISERIRISQEDEFFIIYRRIPLRLQLVNGWKSFHRHINLFWKSLICLPIELSQCMLSIGISACHGDNTNEPSGVSLATEGSGF